MGNDEGWPRLSSKGTSGLPGDPPFPDLPPCVEVPQEDSTIRQYRGSGVPLGDHPEGCRSFRTECLACGVSDTVCTAMRVTTIPMVDRTWDYLLYCRSCRRSSSYSYWQ